MKKKILIAEDDLDMLNLYRGVLGDVFEIIPATNGKEAVELAVAEVPDLILMDITMPETHGLQAARLIRIWVPTERLSQTFCLPRFLKLQPLA